MIVGECFQMKNKPKFIHQYYPQIFVLMLVIVLFSIFAYIEYQRNPPKFDEFGNQIFTLPIQGERVCLDYVNGSDQVEIVAVGEECLNYEW